MSLKSFFGRSKFDRNRRTNHGHAIRRLRFELLDDRRMLSFTPAGNHPTIGTPSSIVTADFNNDGNLDLATCANATTGSVSVLLGDGAGGFGAAQRTVFGSGLSSLDVADINNDTRPDLLVTDYYNGASVLIGIGDGTFQAAVPLNLSGGHFKEVVAVGRSSHGNTEILVSWFGPDWQIFVQVHAGNLQGGFIGGQDAYYWGYGEMAPVDLNNDGHLDVATGDGVVFLGDINQSLQFDWGQTATLTGGAIATGDFTGDGNADVIVAGSSTVAVLRGRGDGDFEAPIHHPATGTFHTAVATDDFNGDGKLDAVVIEGNTGTSSVMLGNGDGTLYYFDSFTTGTSPSGVVIGDFNGDGHPDMAVSNAVSRTVSILLNDGVWAVEPVLPGDYNQNNSVDAADYVVWRKAQGTTVTQFSGADGSGNGVVDQDDYGVWRAHFGQTASPPTAASGESAIAKMERQAAQAAGVHEQTNLVNSQVGEGKLAVEARGASEEQRAVAGRDSAFVELLAHPARSRAEFRHTVRSSPVATVALEASRRDDAALMWLSQSDAKQAVAEWENGSKLDDADASNEDAPLFDSIDKVFALLAIG